MSTAAIVLLVVVAFRLGAHALAHGKPKTGRYSFFVCFNNCACLCGLLYWGGFFARVAA